MKKTTFITASVFAILSLTACSNGSSSPKVEETTVETIAETTAETVAETTEIKLTQIDRVNDLYYMYSPTWAPLRDVGAKSFQASDGSNFCISEPSNYANIELNEADKAVLEAGLADIGSIKTSEFITISGEKTLKIVIESEDHVTNSYFTAYNGKLYSYMAIVESMGKPTEIGENMDKILNSITFSDFGAAADSSEPTSEKETESKNVELYNDDYVKVSYISYSNKEVLLRVENKMDSELNCYCSSLAANGESLGEIKGYTNIPPNSKAKIKFESEFEPESAVESVSGTLAFSGSGAIFDGDYFLHADFSNIDVK